MKQKIDEASVEQETCSKPFFCLQSSGFWLPSTLKQTYQKVLYRLFSIFAYTSVVLQVVGILANIVTEGKDFGSLLEIWFVLAILLFTLSKGLNILIKRDLLYNHLRESILARRWTMFRDPQEKTLVEKSKKDGAFIFKVWAGSLFVMDVFLIFNPIITENPDKKLMLDCYSPCDRQVPICFWICYIHQAYSYVTVACINVSCDCLVYSLIERLCAYVRIFQHRLKLLPVLVKTGALSTAKSELDYLKECIMDHQNISIMANELYVVFNVTVVVHFFLSFTAICTNVFTLTKLELFSSVFVSIFIHFLCVLLENLFYSWYGFKFQEVTEEIPYTIFAMDWTVLNKNTIKLMRFTMLFASKPIPLFNNFIVDLSPEMFLKVLRVSYSTLHVLNANK